MEVILKLLEGFAITHAPNKGSIGTGKKMDSANERKNNNFDAALVPAKEIDLSNIFLKLFI